MTTQLMEESDVSCKSEFDPTPSSRFCVSLQQLGVGFSSQTLLIKMQATTYVVLLRKLSAH